MSTPAKELEKDDFPFEVEGEEIEIEDDTPEEDRDKTPMPDEIIQELEADELDEYSDKVKTRLKQMKKVWHDERRAKEVISRQQNESVALNRRLISQNQELRRRYASGEQVLVNTYKGAAELELNNAKKAYKEAYDSGDSDAVVEAQQALNYANSKIERVNNYTPTLQEANNEVYPEPTIQEPDEATKAWQKRNSWYGADSEMTALALGYHQKLEREKGKQYVGTDNYWRDIDATMKKRFPENFGGGTGSGGGKPTGYPDTKPANIVAPASRSTGSKRIVLKQSQVNLAKKLGITPAQYAREFAKLENDNG